MAGSISYVALSNDLNPLLPNFVAGPENRLVQFTCSSDEPICTRGNPFLIVGASGTGKSVIARTLYDQELRATESSLGYVLPAIDYARSYADAVEANKVDQFRETYLSAQVLLIEDVQLIADKGAAQDELAVLIANRVDRDLATICTCHRLPVQVSGIHTGLASRLLPGLTIPVSPPGNLSRKRILRDFADHRGLSISEPIIDRLAKKLPENAVTSIICAVLKQMSIMSPSGEVIDSDAHFADALAALTRPSAPSIAFIAKVVARGFGVKVADLKSSSRRQKVVRARSMAMYFAREYTDQSLQSIGSYFGGRDHSTVIHALKSTEQLIASDSATQMKATSFQDQLKSA